MVAFVPYSWNCQKPLTQSGAYGFQEDGLIFMKNCFGNRQRVCLNSKFSTWEEIISVVPKCSVLSPLLFNIFLNDPFLFVENSDLRNYTDDNTLYSSCDNLGLMKQTLRQDYEVVIKWFYKTCMLLNSAQCDCMCLEQNTMNETIIYNSNEMKSSKEEKILGVIIENKLKFKSHVKKLT